MGNVVTSEFTVDQQYSDEEENIKQNSQSSNENGETPIEDKKEDTKMQIIQSSASQSNESR